MSPVTRPSVMRRWLGPGRRSIQHPIEAIGANPGKSIPSHSQWIQRGRIRACGLDGKGFTRLSASLAKRQKLPTACYGCLPRATQALLSAYPSLIWLSAVTAQGHRVRTIRDQYSMFRSNRRTAGRSSGSWDCAIHPDQSQSGQHDLNCSVHWGSLRKRKVRAGEVYA